MPRNPPFILALTLAVLLAPASAQDPSETAPATPTATEETPSAPPSNETTSAPSPDPEPRSNASSETLNAILEKDQAELNRLLERATKAIEVRQHDLLKALKVQLKSAQNAGDLDSYLEIESEIGQVTRGTILGDSTTQPSDEEGRRTFAALRKAREAYNEAVRNARQDFEKELAETNRKTGEELHKVVRELTRAGQIEAAILARTELQRIQGRKASDLAASDLSSSKLPVPQHKLDSKNLSGRLLKTSWRRTYLATGGEETVIFERGVTHRGQRWDALPDGTLALNVGRTIEIWVFNENLTQAEGYERGSDRVSFTAVRQ